MTTERNGVIITLYSCAGVLRNRVFILPGCVKLCGFCS
uniref:4Fe-4S single cluster domain protein n=1 Tax=virus sp. ctEfN2 TaxID=2825810 RepID=A0A8S5RNA8_9VIRU|nr:MAG TPA: 4Fe-4S single cluster domain protein [virus sp. ctEfN2]